MPPCIHFAAIANIEQSVLDALWQFGVFVKNASSHWAGDYVISKAPISKLVRLLTVDIIFFGIILCGVYLESRFLPWTFGTCNRCESWRTTPDGHNLFTELMKKRPGSANWNERQASSAAHLVCHDLVLHHGVAIALLYVFCDHVSFVYLDVILTNIDR